MGEEKKVIGRTDRIDLPDFGVFNIKAKIDTGAFTSAIHCSNTKITGRKIKKLEFHIADAGSSEIEARVFVAEDFSERKIKNSFGQTETRYVVKASVLVFNEL